MTKKKETQMRICVDGYDVIEKIVKEAGSSGRLYTPIDWAGCRVKMIRIDEKEKD